MLSVLYHYLRIKYYSVLSIICLSQNHKYFLQYFFPTSSEILGIILDLWFILSYLFYMAQSFYWSLFLSIWISNYSVYVLKIIFTTWLPLYLCWKLFICRAIYVLSTLCLIIQCVYLMPITLSWLRKFKTNLEIR